MKQPFLIATLTAAMALSNHADAQPAGQGGLTHSAQITGRK